MSLCHNALSEQPNRVSRQTYFCFPPRETNLRLLSTLSPPTLFDRRLELLQAGGLGSLVRGSPPVGISAVTPVSRSTITSHRMMAAVPVGHRRFANHSGINSWSAIVLPMDPAMGHRKPKCSHGLGSPRSTSGRGPPLDTGDSGLPVLSAAEVIDGTGHASWRSGRQWVLAWVRFQLVGEQLVELEVDAQDAKDRLVAEAPAGEAVGAADGSPEAEPAGAVSLGP